MIKVISDEIVHDELFGFCDAHFKTFVKFVADVKREILAIGGELHSDAEAMLLENGSVHMDLWGGNFYPWKVPSERLEFTSFINIRPRNNNPNMEVMDETIRNQIRELCERFLLKSDEIMSVQEPSE